MMKLLTLNFVFLVIADVITAEDVEYHLLEEQSARTFVGNVADDTNLRLTLNTSEFSRLQFEILREGNKYADWFSIDKKGGQLETTEVIDRETVCSTTLCILGLDIVVYKEQKDDPLSLDLFKAFRVNIILDDLNDNEPNFLRNEVSLNIPESSEVGYVLFINSADDPDSGADNGVKSYELVADDDTFRLQTPDTDGGNLGIVVNKVLDREKKNFYRLEVVANDGGIPVRSGIVMINVTVLDTNDNSPVFEDSEYTLSIQENQPIGRVILQVTAKDNDIDENGEVTYRISSRASQKVISTFEIDQKSGELKIKSNIDFEKDKEFQFVIEAVDKGTTPKSSQALVRVTITDDNDNAPEIHINLPPGGSDIPESADVDRYIAYFDANDPDSGENGTVLCNVNSDYFKIETISTGMYKVKLNRKLDREVDPVHNVIITCSDNGTPKKSNSTVLTIRVQDINDNKPVFEKRVYELSIHENNGIGDPVAMVTASDKDEGENGRITYGIEHDMDQEYFLINGNSGLITANFVFDREVNSLYVFKVIAKDSGDLSSSATVTVTVIDENDGTPFFSDDHYVFYIEEEAQIGTEVGNVTVIDHDHGSNGDVSFLQTFPYTDVFVIDSTTGKITTKAVLDREKKSKYVFDLTAQDKGNPPLKSTAKVEIYVTDINDNVPLISFPTNSNNSVQVPQTTHVGSVVTRVIVTDLDEGLNAKLSYFIMQGDRRGIFRMSNSTGVVTVEKQINENDAGTYTLLIAVQDHGIPQQTSWSSLVLIVEDDNGRQNMIIAIAVSTVTFALSVAMILTIFVIRRRDAMRRKEKETQMKSDKQNFVTGWLTCLSSPSKDMRKMVVSEKVKDTNKQMDYKTGTDLQPIVPETGSTSSDDSKYNEPGPNHSLAAKIDNNLKELSEDPLSKDQDSGFGESLERRGMQETFGHFGGTAYKTSYLDSRGMRIPSPYLDTSLPTRCLKKNENRPQYTRNVSFDDEVLRQKEREKPKVPPFSSFNYRSISDSGQNSSNLFTISENCLHTPVQRQPLGFHSLQRNPHNKDKTIQSQYSFRNPARQELPPISATPEPEIIDSHDLDNISFHKHSYSDNNINISPRSDTLNQSQRSEISFHSPRTNYTFAHSPSYDRPRLGTFTESSRSDTHTDNANYHDNYHDNGNIILNENINSDIVV